VAGVRTGADAWLRPLGGDLDAAVALVCLPHAGGAAAFYAPWAALLPAGVRLFGVQYPGRMDRLREDGIVDMAVMAGRVTDAVREKWSRPIALFGHSLGAAIAYEVALRLEGDGAAALAGLFVSGQGAPSTMRPGSRHHDPDDKLWAVMLALGGIDVHHANNTEFRSLVLPAFRSDLRLVETYGPRPVAPVHAPLIVFRGDADPQVSPDAAAAWAQFAAGRFDLHVLPGGHFFVAAQAASVVGRITSLLVS
jgi:pyochelin biosynthetic protein PchC